MGLGSWWQILLVVVLALILFGGRGKISSVMGDLAKGIKSFKTNLKEDETPGKIEQAEQSSASPSSATTTTSSGDEAAKN